MRCPSTRLAVGAASGRIHIFDARSIGQDGPSLKLEKSLESIDKNTNPMPYSLVFDPQNHDRLLVGYMLSPYMALWRIEEKRFDMFGVEQSGPVWRVAFDPKGKFVASATNDTAIRLWWIDGRMQLPDTLDSVEKEKLLDAAVILQVISPLYSPSMSIPKTEMSLPVLSMVRLDYGENMHRCLRDCCPTRYPSALCRASQPYGSPRYRLRQTGAKSIRGRCPKGLVRPSPLP